MDYLYDEYDYPAVKELGLKDKVIRGILSYFLYLLIILAIPVAIGAADIVYKIALKPVYGSVTDVRGCTGGRCRVTLDYTEEVTIKGPVFKNDKVTMRPIISKWSVVE